MDDRQPAALWWAGVAFSRFFGGAMTGRLVVAVLVGLLTAAESCAQDLMAQCAKIEDQVKRLECFDAVARSAKSAPSSEQKLAAASRAAHTIMGALEAGLSYVQLGDRIATYAGELNAASALAEADNEKAALAKYNYALTCYVDSRALWYADISYNSGNMIRMPVLLVTPGVESIVYRHSLPVVAGDLLGITRAVDAPSAIRSLWARAAGHIRDGDALLKGPANEASSKTSSEPPVRTAIPLDFPVETATRPIDVYESASTASRAFYLLPAGSEFEVLADEGEWRKVRTGYGYIGWIKK